MTLKKNGQVTTPARNSSTNPTANVDLICAKIHISETPGSMLDEFKILNPGLDIDRLKSVIDILFQVSENTGEIPKRTRSGKGHGGIKITIGNNTTTGQQYVHVEGSFHKYRNNGQHNYDDFLISEVPETVLNLCDWYKIPLQSKLNNLAFGINIEVPFDPDQYFEHYIMYKDTRFDRMKLSEGTGIVCVKDQFIIKIYNKGKQYKLPGYRIRIEIKVTKMQFFKSNHVNISTFQDLTNIDNLIRLPEILQKYFDNCLVCDPETDDTGLPEKEQKLLANGKRASYWSGIRKPGTPDYRKQRKQYIIDLKKFKTIVRSLNGDHLHTVLSDLMKKKLDSIRADAILKKGANLPTFTPDMKVPKGANLHLNYSDELPHREQTRTCRFCGIDISHKKKTAKSCSKRCKDAFTNLKLNPKNNLKQRINRRQSPDLLFPVGDYIVLTPYQRDILNRPNSIFNH